MEKKLLAIIISIAISVTAITGCGNKYESYVKFVNPNKEGLNYFDAEEGDKIEFVGELALDKREGYSEIMISNTVDTGKNKYPVFALVYFDNTDLKLETIAKLKVMDQESDSFDRADVIIKGTYGSRQCCEDDVRYYDCIIVDEIEFK